MIASGLKKLASEHGMKVSNGVAYGGLLGYATTMSEGNGYKRIVIVTHFTDVERKNALLALVNQHNLSKEYRVRNLEFFIDGIEIIFVDNPGTMKRIRAFIEWFYPLLSEYSATNVQYCTQCGCEIIGEGCWQLIDGTAFHLHDSCVEKIEGEIDSEYEQKMAEDTGSYITGFVGGLIGALLGAIVWALVLSIGYIASIVGYVIGWLAEKGYTLLKGRQGRGKIVILVLVTLIGIVAGTLGSEVIEMVKLINAGEVPGVVYSDIPLWLSELLKDSEYLGYVLADLGLGLVFAFIGCFTFMRNKGKDVSKTKVIDLK